MKSPWREHAELSIRRVLTRAYALQWDLPRLRLELQGRHRDLPVTPRGSPSTWYRGVKAVAGCSVRKLPDPRQLNLFLAPSFPPPPKRDP